MLYMTGVRLNFQTLRFDDSIGDGFIKFTSGKEFSLRSKQPWKKPRAKRELKV